MPHFEKMLYDQALLVRVYAHAAVALDEPRWRQVVAETVEYVLRDLRQAAGGFSSAEDADSPGPDGHGHEGLFHTWTADEVRAVLGDDADDALDFCGIDRAGNFEGRVDPQPAARAGPSGAAAGHRGRPAATVRGPRAATAPGPRRQGAHRVERADDLGASPRPARCSTSRTGSTPPSRPPTSCASSCAGPTGGGTAPGTPTARRRPATTRSPPTTPPRRRLHPPRRGHRRGPLDRRGPGASPTRCSTTSGTSTTAGCSRHADDGEALVARQKDLFDNATPSANSTAAVALYRLAALTGETRYANHADRILQLVGAVIDQAPSAFSHALAGRRPARARDHRGRRRRRPARPRRRRPRALAARRRARLGRALRLAAVGRPHRRPGLRVPALRLPGAPGHARRAARPAVTDAPSVAPGDAASRRGG